ncbi:acetyl-CoA acetyltransferase 2 [Culex quinquefasciatus]|uniref:Acetyl-CoA acetyltransferase 2 n=1 Tax=Culex quinquefasciatus TaxID=7176 RepID=B0X7U8_CULQU|nr:acetyl-CoA acetyltransferase 2 [Culex quinquefasciatus]|eukprot:XP_001865720.1 acetyl-CoA acetyltransferase 2 [Culex quinquefasciatus]
MQLLKIRKQVWRLASGVAIRESKFPIFGINHQQGQESGEKIPIGTLYECVSNFLGTLSSLSAADLGAVAIKEVLNRAGVPPADVDEVILGQALTAGRAIRCGDASVVVAGGEECMSKSPHVLHLRSESRWRANVDTMLCDGLTDAIYDMHMGVTAENLAKEFEISREEQDAFAAKSQQLAEESQKKGYFVDEIVAVPVPSRKETINFDKDEYPKHGTTVEGLAKLKACFIKDGTVTPGNASGINDSAAAVLLMSGAEVQKRGAKPLARIVAFSQTGICPKVMGAGPITAVTKVLEKAGWKLDEVDLFELNEAFAAQALAVNKGLGVNPERVNVGGGAIALGHPIGASGCRVLVTLLYALKRTGGKRGVASLCVGGGMGVAMAVEIV